MIGEIIYLLLYLSTEIVSYTLAFLLFLGVDLNKSKKKLIGGIIATIVLHIMVLINTSVQVSSGITVFTMIIIPFLFFNKIEKRNFLIYPVVIFGTSIIGVSAAFLLSTILNMPVYLIIKGNWFTLLCQCFPMIVLIILFGINKITKKKLFLVNLDIKQYILFYLVTISLFFIMAPIQNLTTGDLNKININVVGITAAIVCIILQIVTIWQGIIVKKEKELRDENFRNEQYLFLQREYYEKMLHQDEKMRRFRHDMNTHLVALLTYAKNNEIDNVKEYLENIISESALNIVTSYTGNRTIDAIIELFVSEAKEYGIKISVRGKVLQQTIVSVYDVCTIISNLLRNAIEASLSISDQMQRQISLDITMYNEKIYIMVKNNVNEKIEMDGDCPISTKKDNSYHGLGYGNIKYIINKYNGFLECCSTDQYYIVEIGL